ncbi:glycosyltransferase family 2 protein [Psychrobacter sp. AOP22-C1-C5]|uniref:glycosyltransferase family 2 protein n=1 Tax=Psychrobacter sp. AOP22-C1-C5 TaxID=3457716 RepID=UPI0040362D68
MNGSVNLMRLESKMSVQRLEGGRQRDWDEVRKYNEQPIITIITSTYNVASDLHWTIDSIRNQSYPNLQWIIVDGNSTDGTIEILKEHDDIIDYWFSEPDTGIYDAWNKALEYIKGDWVQFIGAGDELYEKHTLEKVANYLKDAYPKYELAYGQVMHISEKERKELCVSGGPWEKYRGKWSTYVRPEIPDHPSIYHHRCLFERYDFDSNFKISADSLFILEVLQTNNEMLFMNIIIDKFVAGGVSDRYESYPIIYTEMKYAREFLGLKAPYGIRIIGKAKYICKTNLIAYLGKEKSVYLTNKFKFFIDKSRVWKKNCP